MWNDIWAGYLIATGSLGTIVTILFLIGGWVEWCNIHDTAQRRRRRRIMAYCSLCLPVVWFFSLPLLLGITIAKLIPIAAGEE